LSSGFQITKHKYVPRECVNLAKENQFTSYKLQNCEREIDILSSQKNLWK